MNTDSSIAFFKHFEEQVSDKVLFTELAELKAEQNVLNSLQLKDWATYSQIWGLLVFCEHGLYFDLMPNDGIMSVFIRRFSNIQEPKERIIALHEVPNLHFSLPDLGFFDFFTNRKYLITMEFSDDNGRNKICHFQLQEKAANLLDKFKNYNSCD